MLSRQVRSAWAKSRRESGEWLSLVRHCEDSAEVAGYLWHCWLAESTKRFLSEGLTDDEACTFGQFLAATHDVGKLSPTFAIQVESMSNTPGGIDLVGPMRDAGLRFPPGCGKRPGVPHSVISYHAIHTFLNERRGYRPSAAEKVAVIAGGHHGVPPSTRAAGPRDVNSTYFGGPEWTSSRDELISHLATGLDAGPVLDKVRDLPPSARAQVLWTGFVIMCDWIASSDLFPLTDRTESEDAAATAWDLLALPEPWSAHPIDGLDHLLTQRFDLPAGATPNVMQQTVVDAARAMSEPGMLIVEATMGSGKTEAALAAAEHIAARFGCSGVFVALPTMATSNAMFDRVHRWLLHQDSDLVTSISLAHGKSNLNEEFTRLRPRLTDIDSGGHSRAARCAVEVVAHQWFFGRKRSMLANFVVGTIDQLLFAGLKAKHVVLRHLALSNKVVILDEVHAADDYMRVYLVRVLEWLAAYRVPVILLSATLPPAQRLELAEAYERGRGWDGTGEFAATAEYPIISSVGESRRTYPVEPGRSVEVALERLDDEDDVLVRFVHENLDDGGCLAIIRNTVGRAQATARLLRAEFGDDVVLVHSRFVQHHRAELEKRLVARLGRDGSRPHRLIVVATQVIEQSLDLDFDLMISDLAPVDLVLQRLGRLHRHQRANRGAHQHPRLVVTAVGEWFAGPPELESGARSVYGEARLLRSAAVLRGLPVIAVPQDIPVLVQRAYAKQFDVADDWRAALDIADAKQRAKVAAQQQRAEQWRISGPSKRPSLLAWLDTNVGDVDDPKGFAKVRDTEESIEVLVTRRVGDVVYLLPQCGGDSVVTEFEPGSKVARKVLGSAVRLPRALCINAEVTERTIAELEKRMYLGWQDSRWLAGELVLELNVDNEAELQGYRLRYDDTEGLVHEKLNN
ncbi:CRISPR-associated helicase Cas3' [Gordonia sp. NPDC003585]|uniref:CRISPR-associated helicase Cas3' n=1 Tax=Gordonia sp. NPDC003585 TaxID=3154275 RepID=UPI0033B7A6B3